MEVFLFVLILGVLVWFRNSVLEEMRKLSYEIRFLKESIQKMQKQEKEAFQQKPASTETVQEKPQQTEPEKEITPPVVEVISPVIEKEASEEEENIFKQRYVVEERIHEETGREKWTPKPEFSKPSFFERHPDLEKFIGENLINKIGIAILVLGIGYFVKYAIDKDWINEIGRVGIGVLAGGLLIGIAHRLNKTYKAFSSVLVGGGLSVLYFTIAIAFHQYHIFSQAAAFAIMVVITGFAVALSLAYDRVELAVLALIGGFASPFILSTGEGNYIILFTYLLILDCGMLVLAYLKKWNLVNILCYVFTVLIYGTWVITKCLNVPDAPYAGALAFGAAFYLIFFLMNIVYNLKNKIAFKAFEIGMLLSNTFLFYGAGMSILYYYFQTAYQGVFTALLGIFNFGFAFVFYKNKSIDRNLIYLLIGLVLTFLSLTAPVQLEGNYITLFWSAEAVLLLWFSMKSGIKLIKITAFIVNILMFISLFMDWSKYYLNGMPYLLPAFLNKAFITSFVSFASVFLSGRLMRSEPDYTYNAGKSNLAVFKAMLKIAFVVILYFMFLLEINYQLIRFGHDLQARNISLGVYNFSFLTIAYIYLRKRTSGVFPFALMVLSTVLLISYLFTYNSAIIHVRSNFLVDGFNGVFFILHFLLAGLIAAGIYVFYRSANNVLSKNKLVWIKWITVFLIVFLCSAELNHIVTWISFRPDFAIRQINNQVFKAGYTVLWGIISLVLMQQGMRRKDRLLRIISLSLFFITILKLFLSDIKGVSEGGRIGAFISLGVLLLVVSFMYQRLKNLILKNEQPAQSNDSEEATKNE